MLWCLYNIYVFFQWGCMNGFVFLSLSVCFHFFLQCHLFPRVLPHTAPWRAVCSALQVSLASPTKARTVMEFVVLLGQAVFTVQVYFMIQWESDVKCVYRKAHRGIVSFDKVVCSWNCSWKGDRKQTSSPEVPSCLIAVTPFLFAFLSIMLCTAFCAWPLSLSDTRDIQLCRVLH